MGIGVQKTKTLRPWPLVLKLKEHLNERKATVKVQVISHDQFQKKKFKRGCE